MKSCKTICPVKVSLRDLSILKLAGFLLGCSLTLNTSSYADEMYMRVQKKILKTTIENTLKQLLGKDNNLQLNLPNTNFIATDILIADDNPKNDFLVTYGQTILSINFKEAFDLDITLKNTNANVEIPDFNLDLKETKESNGNIIIPFDLLIKLNAFAKVGATETRTMFLQSNQSFISRLSNTPPSSENKQAEVLKKLITGNGNPEILPEDFRKAYDPNNTTLKEEDIPLYVQAHLLDQYRKQNSSTNGVLVSSGEHTVEINDLEVIIKGKIIIKHMDSPRPVISFQIDKGDDGLVDIDNLDENTFDNKIITHINAENFQLDAIKILTYNFTKKCLEIFTLEDSENRMKKVLINDLAIPAIKKVLRERIPTILKEKVYNKLPLDTITIPFSNVKSLSFSSESLFKKIETMKDAPEVLKMIAEGFDRLNAQVKLNSLQVDQEGNLVIGFKNFLKIDNTSMSDPTKKIPNPLHFPMDKNADIQFQLNSDFILNLVNFFDEQIISKYSQEIPWLQDSKKKSLLLLGDEKNHDIFINLNENKIDLSLMLSIDVYKMQGIIGFIANSANKIEAAAKTALCALAWKEVKFYLNCSDSYEENLSHSPLTIGFDFLAYVKGENITNKKLILFSQDLTNLFVSKKMNDKQKKDVENHSLLGIVRSILSYEWARNKLLIFLNEKLPDSFQLQFADASNSNVNDPKKFLTSTIDLSTINTQATIPGIELKDFNIQSEGVIDLKVKIRDTEKLLKIAEIPVITLPEIKAKNE